MRLFTVGFVAGAAWLQRAAALPDTRALPVALALLLAARLAGGWVRAALVVAAGIVGGHDFAAWRAQERLADELPPAWEGRDIELEGVVAGLPQEGERGTRFLFEPRAIVTPGARIPSRISLTWYSRVEAGAASRESPPAIRAGERWRLAVRLKRPRGLANPHAFDFEPWALQRGIRAMGYVRASPAPERVRADEPGWPQSVHRLRGEIRDSMRAALGEGRMAGVMVALAVGDQDSIAAGDWETFWRTGVGHLVSISGLHVTMFAALAFALVRFAWVRVPALALAIPARKAGAVAGVAAAGAYTLLAGFAIPAQRTFVMLAVAAACLLADRHASPSRVLAAAALAVLLLDPWAVLTPGFWLSFGAVGAIFLALGLRAGATGGARGAVTSQVAVTLALLPLLATLFGEVSVVSPVANAVAIPLVSLVVVPLTLAGALLHWPALLAAAHFLLEAAMGPLEWLAALPGAVWESAAVPPAVLASAVAAAVLLLAPRGIPLRLAGAALLMPLAFLRAPSPGEGEAWVDVLDVGQGLAVVVRTARHALVVDAGPSWSADSDSGGRIVMPFLRGEGVRRLDGLAITHADDDHAGGAASVARSRAPPWVLSTLPTDDPRQGLAEAARPCVAGVAWEWDGVAFQVLHPAPAAFRDRRRENDRSCVIRVATSGGAVLLAADIERLAEAELVARTGPGLAADVLVVPHHGSRTSSTPAFVAAVSPAFAIVSAGWRNRFSQPSPEVVARYRSRGALVLRTDLQGALRARLPARPGLPVDAGPLVPVARYWSDRRPAKTFP